MEPREVFQVGRESHQLQQHARLQHLRARRRIRQQVTQRHERVGARRVVHRARAAAAIEQPHQRRQRVLRDDVLARLGVERERQERVGALARQLRVFAPLDDGADRPQRAFLQ